MRREEYVGQWLPEPLVTDERAVDADPVALAESLSLAFLTLLERLTPIERAVFLLHDVFAYPFDEIAQIVGQKQRELPPDRPARPAPSRHAAPALRLPPRGAGAPDGAIHAGLHAAGI